MLERVPVMFLEWVRAVSPLEYWVVVAVICLFVLVFLNAATISDLQRRMRALERGR